MPSPDRKRSILRPAGLATGTAFGILALLAVVSARFPDSALRAFFATACHQQPDRSHWVGGEPLAVCVRCFWLYVGLAIGHLRYTAWPDIPASRRRLLVSALALAVADWLAGWLGLLPPLTVDRAVTGFLLGVALAHYSLPGLVEALSPTLPGSPHKPQPPDACHEPVRS